MCSISCPGTEVNCAGTCVNPASDPTYCGATSGCGAGGVGSAGVPCMNGQVCNGGACSVSCPGAEVNCGAICVNPTTDPTYCGATPGCGVAGMGSAGTPCTNGQVCNGGACSVSCPGAEVNCAGACVDPSTDPTHCGATVGCGAGGMGSAGTPCVMGTACANGICAATCGAGQVVCSGACTNTAVDPANCGACGTVCTAPPSATPYCSSGGCGASCKPGFVSSGGGCGVALPPGAISWYQAEGNYFDALGANNGAPNGSVTFTAGEVGQAFLFDGSSNANSVTASSNGLPTGSADRTAEGWVRFDNFGAHAYQAVFEYGAPNGNQEFGVAVQSGQLIIDYQFASLPGPTITQGQVYHFAAVYASGTASLYLNGASVAQQTVALNTAAGTPLVIGQSPNAVSTWGNTELAGIIDELTFYGRALTATEIQNIYLAGPVGKIVSCPATEVTCGARCVNPATDPINCGATAGCGNGTGSAGVTCGPGTACANGTCAVSCPAGEVDCGGACIEPATDPNYCGASGSCTGAQAGTGCSSTQRCSNGQCCASGFVNCGGTCIDPASSNTHCGASGACTGGSAGMACTGGDSCAGGVCAPSSVSYPITTSSPLTDLYNNNSTCDTSGEYQNDCSDPFGFSWTDTQSVAPILGVDLVRAPAELRRGEHATCSHPERRRRGVLREHGRRVWKLRGD